MFINIKNHFFISIFNIQTTVQKPIIIPTIIPPNTHVELIKSSIDILLERNHFLDNFKNGHERIEDSRPPKGFALQIFKENLRRKNDFS